MIDMENRDSKTLSENFEDMNFGFNSLPPSPRPEKPRRMSLYGTSAKLDDHIEMATAPQSVVDSAEADAEQPMAPVMVSC